MNEIVSPYDDEHWDEMAHEEVIYFSDVLETPSPYPDVDLGYGNETDEAGNVIREVFFTDDGHIYAADGRYLGKLNGDINIDEAFALL